MHLASKAEDAHTAHASLEQMQQDRIQLQANSYWRIRTHSEGIEITVIVPLLAEINESEFILAGN